MNVRAALQAGVVGRELGRAGREQACAVSDTGSAAAMSANDYPTGFRLKNSFFSVIHNREDQYPIS
jgi:hypothetical protein